MAVSAICGYTTVLLEFYIAGSVWQHPKAYLGYVAGTVRHGKKGSESDFRLAVVVYCALTTCTIYVGACVAPASRAGRTVVIQPIYYTHIGKGVSSRHRCYDCVGKHTTENK